MIIPTPTRDQMLLMVNEMKIYGGSFVQALADCFILADENNLHRLYTAFPEICVQYLELAETKWRKKVLLEPVKGQLADSTPEDWQD